MDTPGLNWSVSKQSPTTSADGEVAGSDSAVDAPENGLNALDRAPPGAFESEHPNSERDTTARRTSHGARRVTLELRRVQP
jgi:hypothetical protein